MGSDAKNRCTAITKKGEQCKRNAIQGGIFCSTHLKESNSISTESQKPRIKLRKIFLVLSSIIGFIAAIIAIYSFLEQENEKNAAKKQDIPFTEGLKFKAKVFQQIELFQTYPGNPEYIIDSVNALIKQVEANKQYEDSFPLEVATLYLMHISSAMVYSLAEDELYSQYLKKRPYLKQAIRILKSQNKVIKNHRDSILLSKVDSLEKILKNLNFLIPKFQDEHSLNCLEDVIHNLLFISMPFKDESYIYAQANLFYKIIELAVIESKKDFDYLHNSFNGRFNVALEYVKNFVRSKSRTISGGYPHFFLLENGNTFVEYDFVLQDTLRLIWEVNTKRELILPKSIASIKLTNLIEEDNINIETINAFMLEVTN